MGCVILRNFKEEGALALEAPLDFELVSFAMELKELLAGKRKFELLLLSDADAYPEYAPYTFVKDRAAFRRAVEKKAGLK